jgi:hypothetical protein
MPSLFSPEFMSSKLNHCWNESRSSKISGRIKLSNDHSSARLFCKSASLDRLCKAAYMERCTRQNQPVGTGIALQFPNKSIISLLPSWKERNDSLAIQILQSMSLIYHNIFPQETRQKLLVVHTNLIGRYDDWESRTGVGPSFM